MLHKATKEKKNMFLTGIMKRELRGMGFMVYLIGMLLKKQERLLEGKRI